MLSFLGRGFAGSLLIWGVSYIASDLGITLTAGINLFTFLCSAILGLPGVLLVYGLSFIQLYV